MLSAFSHCEDKVIMAESERDPLLDRSSQLQNVLAGDFGSTKTSSRRSVWDVDSQSEVSDQEGFLASTGAPSHASSARDIGSGAPSFAGSSVSLMRSEECTPNYMELTHSKETILQACVFIEDAIQYRSIHHRVDRNSLLLYRFYYSRPSQWFLYFIIFVVHILAFFESPSSLSKSSSLRTPQTRLELPCGVTEGVELFCLLVLLTDMIIKGYLIGKKQFFKSMWLMAYAFVLATSIVDWFVTVSYGCNEIIRVRRMLRPFFLLQNSSVLKKTVKSLRKTLPQVMSVLLLLFMHLYFFAVFGMLLFPKPAKRNETQSSESDPEDSERLVYFSSLGESIMNLLILLTTANNPDVTLPAYNQSRFYVLYFILFLAIGLYCLMNMLTAVIYNQFRGYFSNSIQASLFRRRLAIRAAFEVLRTRTVSLRYQSSFSSASGGVPTSALRQVIMESYMRKPYRDAILLEMESNPDCFYRYSMFITLFEVLEVDLTKGPKPPLVERRGTWVQQLQTIFSHKFFNKFGCVVAAMNVICITVELAVEYDHISTSRDSILGIFNLLFIIYYAFEQIMRLWALGWRRYCHEVGNIFDGLITIIIVVVEIVFLSTYGAPYLGSADTHKVPLWDFIRIINMLIMVRLVRMIVTQIKPMFIVSATLLDLMKNLRPFAGVLVIIFYVYAVLGMEIFQGKIVYVPRNATNRTISYKCGEYAQLDYWANNFDDFGAALVVLWDVMVVNNWHIFLHVYSDVMNKWTQLYFVTWWLLSVVICLNLFTALILENFIMRWDKQNRPRDRSMSTDTYESDFNSSFMTVHDMFRNQLQEPSEDSLVVELRQHPHFRSSV